ncbi:hypothetical protein RD1_0436 [Roseobacter denitrificans OCh 114]|uniref:Uncharacterized protein n=1 Tax=Roseobacter denitrificans (strain ATCC 33942 / OCh 114) TaxID=375451 RepID=Q16CZ2_ROSDO|nr:hypothetical protein RD1_0436 [Roseobacter denitrificans OCh 114]
MDQSAEQIYTGIDLILLPGWTVSLSGHETIVL